MNMHVCMYDMVCMWFISNDALMRHTKAKQVPGIYFLFSFSLARGVSTQTKSRTRQDSCCY